MSLAYASAPENSITNHWFGALRRRKLPRLPLTTRNRTHAEQIFWWSAIRLDSDSTKKPNLGATSCKDSQENCGTWELRDRWVYPGIAAQFLMASALPAFIIGGLAVSGLGKLGISQVPSFMLLMPALICAWYFLIGWLLDRWIRRRLKRRTQLLVNALQKGALNCLKTQ